MNNVISAVKNIDDKKFENILIGYRLCNNDYGFFAKYEEIYYPLKGIKIKSSLEKVSNSLKEIDYYLLENNEIGRFVNNMSLEENNREVLELIKIKD